MQRILKISMVFGVCLYTASFSSVYSYQDLIFSSTEDERACTGAFDCETAPTKGVNDGGYWYDFDDQKEGGTSKVTYPVEPNENGSYVVPMIEEFGAISITMTAGPDAEYPFVGYGFDLVNSAKDGYDIAANWGAGIAFSIANSAKLTVELEAIDDIDTKDDHYSATIPASTTARVVELTWDDFEQAGWGNPVEKSLVLANTAAIKLVFRGTKGKTLTNEVSVSEIGTIRPQSIKSELKLSPNVQFSNRSLVFEHIMSLVDVEVVNLQGQIVLNSKINNTTVVDLSNLSDGVYIIRASGKSVNFVKKVLLK